MSALLPLKNTITIDFFTCSLADESSRLFGLSVKQTFKGKIVIIFLLVNFNICFGSSKELSH